MYGKIFQSLYQGTLCGHAAEILVFTNLLAFKDKDQFVDKHPKVIAFEVGLSEDEVRAAIKNLEGPDPESRTPDEGGARIRRADEHREWGWYVVNGGKYDAIRNAEERRRQNAQAQRRKRERDSKQPSDSVTQDGTSEDKSAPVSVAGSVSKTPPTPSGENESEGFREFYSSYPRKEARPRAWKAWKTQKAESHLPAILAALEAKWPHQSWLGLNKKYLPLPASWINDRRWEDESSSAAPSSPASVEELDQLERDLGERAGLHFEVFREQLAKFNWKGDKGIAEIRGHFEAKYHEELI